MSGSGPIYEYQRELTAKLDAAIRECDEAQAEVERWVKEVVDARFLAMTLYSAAGGEDFVASLPHMMVEQIRQVRRRECDLAYQRGAEAMREAAAKLAHDYDRFSDIEAGIRALPLPEAD